jgi:hypothetical protein
MASGKSALTPGVCIYTGSLDETLGMWELHDSKVSLFKFHSLLINQEQSFIHDMPAFP